jgi:hypothetical protein
MDYQEQARRFIDALHALEGGEDALDQICALFSDDAVLTNAALRLVDKEYHGRAGCASSGRPTGAPSGRSAPSSAT